MEFVIISWRPEQEETWGYGGREHICNADYSLSFGKTLDEAAEIIAKKILEYPNADHIHNVFTSWDDIVYASDCGGYSWETTGEKSVYVPGQYNHELNESVRENLSKLENEVRELVAVKLGHLSQRKKKEREEREKIEREERIKAENIRLEKAEREQFERLKKKFEGGN